MNLQEPLFFDIFEGQSQLLSAALDAAINGIIITDHQRHNSPIIYCNKSFEKLTGYSQLEVLGKNCRLLQRHETNQVGRFTIKEALLKGEECKVELKNFKKDGSLFWNELSLSPIKNRLGHITNYIGIQCDITERKERERFLEDELIKSIKLQDLKDEFISIASHELKTPVTTLKASLQLLERLKADLSSQLAPIFIDRSIKSVNKMSALIDELLLFTRLNEGQLTLNKVNFKLIPALREWCDDITDTGFYQVNILGDESLEVTADKNRMEQVVINLVNNAVKYAADSKVLNITIEKDDNMVKILVADNGPGILPEQIPHLFERYYRINHVDKKYSGLGLGLFICAEIVRKYGGEIGVISERGYGSTFWITIPLIAEHHLLPKETRHAVVA